MSESSSPPLIGRILNQARGKAKVAVNGVPFSSVELTGESIIINIENGDTFTRILSILPKKALKLSILHKSSGLLKKLGIKVEIDDSNGELIVMGRGVHSILGGVKVKALKLRKYLPRSDRA